MENTAQVNGAAKDATEGDFNGWPNEAGVSILSFYIWFEGVLWLT
jgi:hypothetical protein